MYHNVQSLMDKLDEIKIICMNETPDILCCAETWTDKSHSSDEVKIPNYRSLIRNRSDNPNRGGLCVYVKDGIKVDRFEIPNHKTCKCEEIWCKITDESGKKIILAAIYRSHQNTDFIEHMERNLDYVSSFNLPTILVGDFNYDLLKDNMTTRQLNDMFNRQCMD